MRGNKVRTERGVGNCTPLSSENSYLFQLGKFILLSVWANSHFCLSSANSYMPGLACRIKQSEARVTLGVRIRDEGGPLSRGVRYAKS